MSDVPGLGSAETISVYMDGPHWVQPVFRFVGDHDVEVAHITPHPPEKTVVGQGFSITVNVTVGNLGDIWETITVTLDAEGLFFGEQVLLVQVVSLPVGEEQTVEFTWFTENVVKDNYTLSAHASIVPYDDAVPSNNELIYNGIILVTIPGDVDGDRSVAVYDIADLTEAYGSSEGDLNYVPNCDIDNDADVDIFDVVIAVSNYGESW